MDLKSFEISWVDLAVVVVLLVGVARGRRRGMSQELLDVLKWLLVVVFAGHFYEPVGTYLAENSVFSLLACYVASYSLLALSVILVFSLVRRGVGQKLVGSDLFGSGEYYLGMMGGMLRYACVVLVVLSYVNARHYSAEEIRASALHQQQELGSELVPSYGKVRQEIVEHSWIGRLSTSYLSALLIRPTVPDERPLVQEGNLIRARERQIDAVLDTKQGLDNR